MEELFETSYTPIPQILCHYTKPENFTSIVSGKGGKDKEICFWAFSNLCKNDTHELEYGKAVYSKVKQWLIEHQKGEYLNDIGDETKSFSLSFTEGANPLEMIYRYGILRLDFDLTSLFDNQELMPCEYSEENEVDKDAELFIKKFEEHFENINQFKEGQLLNLILQGNGLSRTLIENIFLIKRKQEWMKEQEWRTNFFPDKNHPIFSNPNGNSYIKVYFPISCLKAIRLFYMNRTNLSQPSYDCIKYKYDFEKYLFLHNWNIPVIIEEL